MRWRFITLIGTLGLGVLTSCGGKGAADSSSAPGSGGGAGSPAGAPSSAGGTDKAGMGGGAGGPTGTAGYPLGCPSGELGRDTVCVAASDAWAWATSAGGGSSAAGAGGAGGDAGGMSGAAGEVNTPQGCPRTYTIRSHLSFMYSTTYDGGSRMGDECCYASFQPCG